VALGLQALSPVVLIRDRGGSLQALVLLTISLFCGCRQIAALKESTAVAGTSSPPAAVAPGQPDAAAAASKPTVSPHLMPLAKGKWVRLEGIGTATPLEILVPVTFKLTTSEQTEDEMPSAHLKDSAMELVVNTPGAGFFPLSDFKATLGQGNTAVTFDRAEENADGYSVIYRTSRPGTDPRYHTRISRPTLKVSCTGRSLQGLEQAERAASICLTLRAAKRGAPP
jgi:hypothetical protein